MQVILLDRVPNLGNLGDRVDVKAGYARNFLIPQRKAVLATKQNVAYFEARRTELEEKLATELKVAELKATEIMKLSPLTIVCKAGDEGRLFGSVGARDIARAIVDASGHDVSKSQIRLANGVLRTVGEHDVSVQLHSDVFATVVVSVVSEV